MKKYSIQKYYDSLDKWYIVNRKGEAVGLDSDFGPWEKTVAEENLKFALDNDIELQTIKESSNTSKMKEDK